MKLSHATQTAIAVVIMFIFLLYKGCNSCSCSDFHSLTGDVDQDDPTEVSKMESSSHLMCPECLGRGTDPLHSGDMLSPFSKCWFCQGTGVVSNAKLDAWMSSNHVFDNNPKERDHNKKRKVQDSKCVDCHGSGNCSICGGKGWKKYEGHYGVSGEINECFYCHGTGRCRTCHGDGKFH